MTQPDQPLRLVAGEDLKRFVLRSREEILRILHLMCEAEELVSADFDHGNGLLVTTLEALDPVGGRLLLGLGPDRALNARVLASKWIVLDSRHERVQVQFTASGARAVYHEGHAAFAIDLPAELLYLQRRELHRVSPSLRDPVQVRLACGAGEALDFLVQDIGVGGFSGIATLPVGRDVPGTRFSACTLAFRDGRRFTCEVELRAAQPHRPRVGPATTLLRFRFVGLPGAADRVVQQYVLRRQHELRGIDW